MAESTRSDKILPYTGVLAGILFAVAGFVPKVSEKYADPEAMQIMNDNATRNFVSVVASAFFCVAMLWFVSTLRQALRPAEGDSAVSNAAFAGGILVAGSQAISAWILLGALNAADKNDLTSFQTITYLGIDGWLPWVAASAVFYLATGIAALRSAALPRWFAIVTVVLGVLCMLGPAGIAVYLVTPLWLVVAGVLVSVKQRQPGRVAAHV